MKKQETTVQPELLPYLNQAQEQYNNSIHVQRRAMYAEARRKYAVDDKTILYTCFHGRGLGCNPYALFRYIKQQTRFADYTHVWVLDDLNNHAAELEEYKDEKNVLFVEFHSPEYMRYLSSAKYLISNVTEQNYFIKKPGQVILNTWHGIPLKHLGYDIPNGAVAISNTMRNFLFDDYIISPNPFTTWNFTYSYKLKDAFQGKLIETGYPRCDTVQNTDRDAFIAKARNYGVNIDPNKKIILFAPTWRGAQYASPDLDTSHDQEFIKLLSTYVDNSKYQILFKPHQVVYKHLLDNGLLQPTDVPATIDANELLAVTDILISDYSSIFFDFLVTGRPILFYVPDLENYTEERGLYFQVDELPGPVTQYPEQVGEWLAQVVADPDSYRTLFDYEHYTNAIQRFVPNEDGHVCERIVKAVFDGDDTHTISLKSDKTKLLFHVDILRPNGITSALLNLLNHLDYDKYDVTLNTILPRNDLSALAQINPNVRALCRTGVTVSTLEENAAKDYCHDNTIVENDANPLFPKEMYELEFHRCFGEVIYDYIINYSGYNGFWSNVLCSQKNAKQLMWVHNDLKAELEDRIVNGIPIFQKNLPQVFKHYRDVDKIVGCSKSTMEVNRDKLSTPETFSKFTYMHNMLNEERIKKSLDDQHLLTLSGRDWICIGNLNPAPVSSHMQALVVPMPHPGNTAFVTVGRLSPEKNHENLIRAFARLAEAQPNVQLYIIGDGPLKKSLRQLITELNLTGKVILTGNLSNPFIVEKYCQCFILPSYHEGMPMVLLEARTLGLPIIVSDFSTVTDSLRENGQLLIQTDEDSIYEGMLAFLQGRVPNEFPFDPYEYNQSCLQEFEALLQREGEAE